MGKLEELDSSKLRLKTSHDKKCNLHEILDACDEQDRKLLVEWVYDDDIEATKLSRELLGLDIELGDKTIGRHRHNGCKYCQRYPAEELIQIRSRNGAA